MSTRPRSDSTPFTVQRLWPLQGPRHFRPRQYRAALGLNIHPGLFCNSVNRREGCFHGKLAASRSGFNVTVGQRSLEYLTDREVVQLARQIMPAKRRRIAICESDRIVKPANETRALRNSPAKFYLGNALAVRPETWRPTK
jgi:hypothetical protein